MQVYCIFLWNSSKEILSIHWRYIRWAIYEYQAELSTGESIRLEEFCEAGKSLPEAITNAAFSLADNSTIPEEWL